MKFPNTVSVNTYRAYINPAKVKITQNKSLNSFDLDWDINYPDSLRISSVKQIGRSWGDYPAFAEIPDIEDRNYLLDIIDVNVPIRTLAAHITDDVFWRRCFENYWKNFFPTNRHGKSWIQIFMEQYLSEQIEQMKFIDYSEETLKEMLEVCAPWVKCLKIKELQPSLEESNDHIPLDFILLNLPDLESIDLTFDIKSIGNIAGYYLGCADISKNDIKKLALGLESCYEMVKVRLHSTRLNVYMVKLLARAIDKAGHNLTWLEFSHCRIGDKGLTTFIDTLTSDSFPNLKHLILPNNDLTKDGALQLAQAIQSRTINTLDLRFNPIGSDGAAAIFAHINRMSIENLNISCCSIDNSIEILLLKVLKENKSLKKLNLSANRLGSVLGSKIAEMVIYATQLQEFDIRNTDIYPKDKSKIDAKILDHRDKL